MTPKPEIQAHKKVNPAIIKLPGRLSQIVTVETTVIKIMSIIVITSIVC